jgi:hypothetical protein
MYSYEQVRFGGYVAAFFLAMLNSCSSMNVHIPAKQAPANDSRHDYIDLESGWRVRVVTPILKSGGFRLKSSAQPSNREGELTLMVGSDFVGYEIAYYAVKARFPSGTRMVFNSAEIHNKDEVVPATRPLVPLFRLPAEVKYVRLIYMARLSETDHDMAVVAAKKKEALDLLTEQVLANPSNCGNQRYAFCSWIPQGISVTPEMRMNSGGSGQWRTAN